MPKTADLSRKILGQTIILPETYRSSANRSIPSEVKACIDNRVSLFSFLIVLYFKTIFILI